MRTSVAGMLRAIAAPETIKLWKHVSEVVGVLATEVHFLNLAAPAPYASLRGRAVYDCVVVEHLVFCGDHEDACADDAIGGDTEGMVDACAGADGIAVADSRGLDTWKGIGGVSLGRRGGRRGGRGGAENGGAVALEEGRRVGAETDWAGREEGALTAADLKEVVVADAHDFLAAGEER